MIGHFIEIDHVIAGEDLYGGTHRLLTFIKDTNKVNVQHLDTTNTELIKSNITPETKMIDPQL